MGALCSRGGGRRQHDGEYVEGYNNHHRGVAPRPAARPVARPAARPVVAKPIARAVVRKAVR